MKFDITDERLGYAEALFEKVAGVFVDMLRENFLFSAKLNVLTVTADYAPDDLACGEFCTCEGRNKFEIRLHLSEDETQSAYIMAHELAHCLMENVGIGRDHAAHDGSVPLNSQIHRMGADGAGFGFGLEEAMADVIGMEAACRTPGVDGGKLRGMVGTDRPDVAAATALVECFGEPIGALAQLDEVRRFGKKVHFKTPYFPYDEAEVIPVGEECGSDFWSMAVNHSFPEIMRRYDALMEVGAFRRLCEALDAYCRCDRTQPEPAGEEMLLITMQMKNLMEEIRCFRAAYEAVEPAWSERAEVEESLREAAARLKCRCDAFDEAYRMDRARTGQIAQFSEHFSILLDAFEQAEDYAAAVGSAGAALEGDDPFAALRRASAVFDRVLCMPAPPLTVVEEHIPVLRSIFASAMEVVQYYDEHPFSE